MLHERLQKSVPAWTLIAVAVGILMLFGIGSGLYNSGWADGLNFGLLAGGSEGSQLLTSQVHGVGGYGVHHGWGHAGILGGFFRFVFFLFFLSIIFKVLGFWRWKMHHGWHHGQHGGHPGWQGGPWQGQPQPGSPWHQPKPESSATPSGQPTEQPQPAKPVSFV